MKGLKECLNIFLKRHWTWQLADSEGTMTSEKMKRSKLGLILISVALNMCLVLLLCLMCKQSLDLIR